jgi:hypothetical protein
LEGQAQRLLALIEAEVRAVASVWLVEDLRGG